jgi:formylglycine-generating enzyme required for sulfatase activity
MSGGVWEWTRSQYGPWQLKDGDWRVKTKFKYPYRTDEREHLEGGLQMARVLRGGSWVSLVHFARVAYRVRNQPAYRSADLGFRVVVGFAPVGSTL